MDSTISTEVKSHRKESAYILNWIIEDFDCKSVGGNVCLPSVKFEFDMCTSKHFIGCLSLGGDSCASRKLSLKLQCTTDDFWKVRCNIRGGHDIAVDSPFNQDNPSQVYSVCSASRGHPPNCILKNTPVKLNCRISIVSYEAKLDYPLPIKESQLKYELLHLFESKKDTDVSFNVAGKEFHAHKIILACRSAVFKAMFDHQMAESLSNKVEIEDMEPDVFEEMLRFIYTDEVLNMKTMAGKLLAASDKYNLPRLMSMCENELAGSIAIENVAETLLIADLHGAEELRKYVVNFIKEHKIAVLATPGWEEFHKNNVQLVADLYMKLIKI